MNQRAERTKVMSLRLPESLAAAIASVARTDDVPISEAIRYAIAHYVADRQADLGFQKRLMKRIEEDQQVLEELRKGRKS